MKKKKWTAESIAALKGERKFACLTAYDFPMARIMDEVGIPLILVGDSLAMTVLGYETTLPVTMEEMLHHAAAVCRGVENALVVADMPYMSYQVSHEQAVENAGRFMKGAGAGAVKIEGGAFRRSLVECLVENGIPVLGHIGMMPQSIHETGGYKVQGRNEEDAEKMRDDAATLAAAGIFGLVLECIPVELAAEITQSVNVPTIGIGAGPDCDGQILVVNDLLGLFQDFTPKFVKRYANMSADMKAAFEEYISDVENQRFPSDEHCY